MTRIESLLSLKIFVLGLFLICFQSEIYAQNSSDLWSQYVSDRDKGLEPELPDFSFVGYHHGESAIPTSLPWDVFDVMDYGAIPNDGVSDKEAIMEAIKAAENNGSGIVFFPEGIFLTNESTDDINEIIYIRESNVVLKGSGSGENGTVLLQSSYTEPTNPNQFWTSPFLIQFKPNSVTSSHISTIVEDATRESFSIAVADAAEVSVGQWVVLTLSDDDPLLLAEEFYPYDVVETFVNIGSEISVEEIHQVAAVNGNQITFVEPIHRSISREYNWSIRTFSHLEEVGVMDLSIDGKFESPFIHHGSWQDDSGWSGLQLHNVVNSWISNVTFSNLSQAAQFKVSANCSGLNNTYRGNPGHEFLSANNSTGILIGRNSDLSTGVWHGCGLVASSIGNVIWRNYQPGASGIEIHATQPRANCIDACIGGFGFNMGGDVSSLPHHLRHLVIWNMDASNSSIATDAEYEFWQAEESSGNRFIMPIVSGFVGYELEDSQTQVYESPGTHVAEESLYEHQLAYRLGTLPSWIDESSNLLMSIRLDGTALADFNSQKMRYKYVASKVPSVEVSTVDPEAKVDIQYPNELPGYIEVLVTGTNDQSRSYLIDITPLTYVETFNEISPLGWFTNLTYTGDNDFEWSITAKSTDAYLDFYSRNIYFSSGVTGVTSGTIPGGIRSFSVMCKDLWYDGNTRTIELIINDEVIATKTHLGSNRYWFEVSDIDIEGDFVLSIRNASSETEDNTIALDNITWEPMTEMVFSGNNFLSQIALNGKPIDPFFRNVFSYSKTIAHLDEITALPEDETASVAIEDFTSIQEQDTVDIAVTAENGTMLIYQLILSNEKTSLELSNSESNSIKIYPNPIYASHDMILTIETGVGLPSLVEFSDLMGRRFDLVQSNFDDGTLNLKIDADLPKGIYFIQVKSGQHSWSEKLIIR